MSGHFSNFGGIDMRIFWMTTLAATIAASGAALAQDNAGKGGHVYDIKAICGKAEGKIAAPGSYWTAINILNSGSKTAKVEGRLSVALPGLTMGPLNGPVGAELRPNHSMEIDCPTIEELGEGRPFTKGFVLLRSTEPLTVVAVYTQANPDGQAVSIHTERVGERAAPGCADLVVGEIKRPQWDAGNNRSVIEAVIKNIGSVDAPDTLARLIDPGTFQNTGAPYNDVVSTGPISAGGSVTVTFSLPYWVYNPDADLEVTADYKGLLLECNEGNNVMTFQDLG